MHPEIINFDVPEALIGNSNISPQPFDTIRIFGRYEQDPPDVTIRGEVARPGSYALSEGMTAAQLVRIAGGFKRDALTINADLASYQVLHDDKVASERRDVRIGDAVLRGDHEADVVLSNRGDILTVRHQITGWEGYWRVHHHRRRRLRTPAVMDSQQGEHLSDVLRRAGGFQ